MHITTYESQYRNRVADLLNQFFQSSLNEYGQTMDESYLDNLILGLKDTSFIAVEDGNLLGFIAGQVTKQPLSGLPVYQEIVWYVDEKNRKCGIALLRHLEKWCKEKGIKQIIMAFMYNSGGDRLMSFYERMGYRPFETHLIKELS